MITQKDDTVAVHDDMWPQRVMLISDKLHRQFPDDLHGRIEAGTAIAMDPARVKFSGDRWRVQSDKGHWYTINGRCTCRDIKAREGWCKHRCAANIVLSAHGLAEEDLVIDLATHNQTTVEILDEEPIDPDQDAWEQEDAAGPLRTNGLPRQLPRRSIRAIVADLSQPLPQACVAMRPEDGQPVPYLHKETVATLLDTYAPGWHGRVIRIDHIAHKVILTYRVMIPCLEGLVSREATGQEDDVPLTKHGKPAYGDSSSNAEAMAFKRAAAKFGVGAWLYDKGDGTRQALSRYLRLPSGSREQGQSVDS